MWYSDYTFFPLLLKLLESWSKPRKPLVFQAFLLKKTCLVWFPLVQHGVVWYRIV